jgi:hypothetical protein
MDSQKHSYNSNCAAATEIAERELSAFIRAVTELFGPEEAKLSAGDWLGEAELMDSPPQSTSQKCRAVTIAASAMLANRRTFAAFDPCILFARQRRFLSGGNPFKCTPMSMNPESRTDVRNEP